MEERIEEVSAKIAGQEVQAKGLHLNTLLTFAAVVGIVGLGAMGYYHDVRSGERNDAFVAAIKDQTAAIKEQTVAIKEAERTQREGNCLAVFKDAEQCRRIAR